MKVVKCRNTIFFLSFKGSFINLFEFKRSFMSKCTWNDMGICFSCRVEGKSETPTARKVNARE